MNGEAAATGTWKIQQQFSFWIDKNIIQAMDGWALPSIIQIKTYFQCKNKSPK